MSVEDRAVYRTIDYRAEDLAIGDVTRNRYGKWDVVTAVEEAKGKPYLDITFECGGVFTLRTVALVKVQAVKPS